MASAALIVSCAHSWREYEAEDFTIRLSQNRESAIIAGYTGSDTDIQIPPYIKKRPVVGIDKHAFYGKNLTSVTIPAGVTFIGTHAFAYNPLTSVTIMPDQVGNAATVYFDRDAFGRDFDEEVEYSFSFNYRRAGTYILRKL